VSCPSKYRVKDSISDWVLAPATMPWGNRTMLFHDPGGNLINFFSQRRRGNRRRRARSIRA
jgi:hypothetical protein